ncbi:MAG TPA: glycine cleavage system protein GcvH [Candidatus Thermoplasmatota archaeon]|nr:glycine cleavage system protein GcvH [Candidatus Thermoplasmatota archaeon]
MAGASKIPDNVRYTKDHEWVSLSGNRARIGITDYAQQALTDVVFAELPDVGDEFAEHDSMGVVESVKSVSDIFAPLAGKIVAVNKDLDDAPELINQDPYGKGWFCEMEIADVKVYEKLLDAAGYKRVIQGH